VDRATIDWRSARDAGNLAEFANRDLTMRPTVHALEELHREGLLSDEAFDAARESLPAVDQGSRADWGRGLLLVYGSVLLLAGVVFHFAFNWQGMSKFAKFGVVEFALAACVACAWRKGFETFAGQVLMVGASIMPGVLLAVFGQIYQTGADPYELFLGWSALIFGFVVTSQLAGHWFLWLVLLNIGLFLRWEQAGVPAEVAYEWSCLQLGALNGLALAAREWCPARGQSWLGSAWLRPMLVSGVLIPMTFPLAHCVVEADDITLLRGVIGMAWFGLAGGLYWWYRDKLPDINVIGLVIFNTAVILLIFIGDVLLEPLNWDSGWLLAISIASLAVMSGSGMWIGRVSRLMKARDSEVNP
tara:strand:+ start:11583 stop:12659 length:1077 start_codon:yes stop_codon:yes gene_type:complete